MAILIHRFGSQKPTKNKTNKKMFNVGWKTMITTIAIKLNANSRFDWYQRQYWN